MEIIFRELENYWVFVKMLFVALFGPTQEILYLNIKLQRKTGKYNS